MVLREINMAAAVGMMLESAVANAVAFIGGNAIYGLVNKQGLRRKSSGITEQWKNCNALRLNGHKSGKRGWTTSMSSCAESSTPTKSTAMLTKRCGCITKLPAVMSKN